MTCEARRLLFDYYREKSRNQEEIEARLKQWKRPEPKFKKGWLGLYCKLAASGSEGGVMKFDKL